MSVKRFTLGEEQLSSIKMIKIDEWDIKKEINTILNKMMDDTYENLMKEGVGTFGGNKDPSGGVPVWKGEPSKTTYYPGALRDAHNKESNGLEYKAITVNNYLFYAPAVINGHGKSVPNRYHERALNETLKKEIPKKYVRKMMQDWVNRRDE